MVIELFVWIDEFVWFDDWLFSRVGIVNASFRISAGGNVLWTFLFGSFELSIIEICKNIRLNTFSMILHLHHIGYHILFLVLWLVLVLEKQLLIYVLQLLILIIYKENEWLEIGKKSFAWIRTVHYQPFD
jgi:hypothetical protein